MATSKLCDPVNLHRWAGLKGITLVGTGDFTHGGWRRELRENLVEAEPGFYRLRKEHQPEIPDQPDARFVISGEISSIYKKNGRTRKVHNLILLPSLEAADALSAKLESLGMNLHSDGRPILGLDSYRLFQMTLDVCPEAIFIPAHIWTPHFSVFGSNSGFDLIEECYEDLTPCISALETGLSSDPAMNWQWSALDRFRLISNSDAHNPQNLGREATVFEAELSYQGLRKALQGDATDRLAGTVEFFPEEGKYHYDGHRNCGISFTPEQTAQHNGLCPVCGKKVTVGVFNRITALADRPLGFQPEGAQPFQRLIPLKEIIGDVYNVGVNTRKVDTVYWALLREFGPELVILRDTDIERLTQFDSAIGMAISRLRNGQVSIIPGYDGQYGVISVISEEERKQFRIK
ncbi:MAG TPA: endonuclease Q family protein [Bacillota bacterium]|nr:endonuclease Q family protein [Bacillota bacterium]